MKSPTSLLTIALCLALLAAPALSSAEDRSRTDQLEALAGLLETRRDEAGKKADKARATLRKAEELVSRAAAAGDAAAGDAARKAAANARAAALKAERQRDRAARMAVAVKTRMTAIAQGLAKQPAAVAIVHQGTVEIKVGGRWIRIPEGEPLIAEPGTAIRTGADSQVTLQLTQREGKVRVGPNSELTIPEDPSSLDMLFGKIKITVVKALKKEKFQVRTPSAICGVRGTAFRVDHPQDGSTTVTVTAGTVEVSRPDGQNSVLVEAGQQVTIAPGNPPGGVMNIDELREEAWEVEEEK